MTVPGWGTLLTKHRRTAAIAASLVLHGLVVYATSFSMGIGRIEPPQPQSRVIWLGDWPIPALEDEPEPPVPPEIAPPAEIPAPSPLQATNVPVAPRPKPSDPIPDASTEVPPPVEDDAAEDAAATDSPTPSGAATVADEAAPPATERPVPNLMPPGVTFEALRDEAVANLMDRLDDQSNFETFSQEDSLIVAPIGIPQPETSVFDAPRTRTSVMSPSKARSRAGRFVAELCNALTGGFSILGLGISACADGEVYGQLFAHIKPEYMKKRPVCTDTRTGLGPVLAAAEDDDPAFSTVKCRLVYMDEWGLLNESDLPELAAQ